MLLALLNTSYEILLYLIPIPQSIYRIIAFRYMMHLACGIWISDAIKERHNLNAKQIAMMTSAFVIGCLYVGFAAQNAGEKTIFKYGTWGITNFLSCLYIVPLFYITIRTLWNKRINWEPIHKVIALIGRNTYYILCTQMVMFWVIGAVWSRFGVPLIIQVIGNVVLGCISGVVLGSIIECVKKPKYKL